MKIEAVTVCVGYGDFLAATLPHNLHIFDRLVVVTDFEDKETQNICQRYGVDCKPTDVMRVHGDAFNKGLGIDFGLGYLNRDAWVVHLDSDIVLPRTTRHRIEEALLDEDCIYGIDRMNCVGWDAWKRFESDHGNHHQWHQHCILVPPAFPLGARIVLRNHGGYVPIGFFQMFHGKHGRRYPMAQGDAEHTDVLHSLQWPTKNRRLLPSVLAVHLESEPCKMGANWRGRKTQRFGPGAVTSGVNVPCRPYSN
jgi:hypothetical protein